MEATTIYEMIGGYLGISTLAATILFIAISIWTIVWKGLALWKSGRKTKIVWFITLLIMNTFGIFEITYLFIFSKIKNAKQFKNLHDTLLFASVIFGILGIWNIGFLIATLFFLALFEISILQEIVDRKDWIWLILGLILFGIIPIIYYLSKIRIKKEKPKKTAKKKK